MPKFIEDTDEKLKSLETSIASLKKAVADYGEKEEQKESECEMDKVKSAVYQVACVVSDMKWALDYLKSDFNYLYSQFNKHQDKHLPPAPSASHMKKAIETLGWDDEYEVQAPKVVYASDSRGNSFEIEFPTKSSK